MPKADIRRPLNAPFSTISSRHLTFAVPQADRRRSRLIVGSTRADIVASHSAAVLRDVGATPSWSGPCKSLHGALGSHSARLTRINAYGWYARLVGLGLFFERKVGTNFTAGFDSPTNAVLEHGRGRRRSRLAAYRWRALLFVALGQRARGVDCRFVFDKMPELHLDS
jgi:hypothetical protein